MHDFLLAKEIVDAFLRVAKEKNIEKIKSVSLEIGTGILPHGHVHDHEHDHEGHDEELNLENIRFGIENIAKNTILEKTDFKLKRIEGNEWKIIKMEI